jgi:hypothetical protein
MDFFLTGRDDDAVAVMAMAWTRRALLVSV